MYSCCVQGLTKSRIRETTHWPLFLCDFWQSWNYDFYQKGVGSAGVDLAFLIDFFG